MLQMMVGGAFFLTQNHCKLPYICRCVHNYHMGSVHAQNVYGDKFLAILSHILSMKKMRSLGMIEATVLCTKDDTQYTMHNR